MAACCKILQTAECAHHTTVSLLSGMCCHVGFIDLWLHILTDIWWSKCWQEACLTWSNLFVCTDYDDWDPNRGSTSGSSVNDDFCPNYVFHHGKSWLTSGLDYCESTFLIMICNEYLVTNLLCGFLSSPAWNKFILTTSAEIILNSYIIYKVSFALWRSNFFRFKIHLFRLVDVDLSPLLSARFLQACRDFLDLAETHSRRWQRALQYEREQRTHLEETIEQLAKQHNSLERAWREAPTLASSTPSTTTNTTQGELESEWLHLSGQLRVTLG